MDIGQIDLGYIALVLVIILFSMTLHEVMHGFVAYWLGDDTAKQLGRLTLNPIKHIDPFLTILLPVTLAIIGGPIFGGAKPVPIDTTRVRWREWGLALVGIAGPLTNLVIAFICYGIWVLSGQAPASLLGTVLQTAIMVNLGFFAFNILPIPPLDGSRVVYALAPDFIRRGMEAIERTGTLLVFLLVLVASPVIGKVIIAIMTWCLIAFQFVFSL